MQDYFAQSPSSTLSGPADRPLEKMATTPETEVGDDDNGALTRKDLLALSADLKQHFTLLLDSRLECFSNRLSELTTTVNEVSHTAGEAFDLCKSQGLLITNLQASERLLKERVAWLEGKARAMNLKFRGLPELPDLNSNLSPAIASWLASLLHLEDGVAPTLIAAYRVGPASLIKPNFPRDVVVQFLYHKSRDAVLQMARQSSALQYKGSRVLVLLDLPSEVLMKRKLLKPITDHLKAKNVRFRWSAASDIIVNRDGAQYKADDVASGRTLLAALNLPLPPS